MTLVSNLLCWTIILVEGVVWDLADPSQSLSLWLSHGTLGEASFDSVIRHRSNPVYKGTSPYLWPVNGFLASGGSDAQTIYAGLYKKGYAGPYEMLALHSPDKGETWTNAGIVCSLNKSSSWLNESGCPDGSTVPDENGGVHLIFDWNNNGAYDQRFGGIQGEMKSAAPSLHHAGLGYAHGETPTGPWTIADRPLNDAANNTPREYGFVKTYAGTLIQRKKDWLIVTAFGGGSWGMATMTAPNASGPYTQPELMLYPQSDVFHPTPTEFYPAFSYDGFVYAPSTSVATNRAYQALFRAPIEHATDRHAWKLVQSGSLYHWEGEIQGPIFGQTFSAFVEATANNQEKMHLMWPSLDKNSVGNLNLGHRDWNRPYADHGFWVSAPSADSLAVMVKTVGAFSVNSTVEEVGVWGAKPGAPSWTFLWNHRGPLGPYISAAVTNTTALTFGMGNFTLQQFGSTAADKTKLAQGTVPGANTHLGAPLRFQLQQTGDGAIEIVINGTKVCCSSSLRLPVGSVGGAMAVMAKGPSALHVVCGRFRARCHARPARTKAAAGAAPATATAAMVVAFSRRGYAWWRCTDDERHPSLPGVASTDKQPDLSVWAWICPPWRTAACGLSWEASDRTTDGKV
jgi:hypothetical protein